MMIGNMKEGKSKIQLFEKAQCPVRKEKLSGPKKEQISIRDSNPTPSDRKPLLYH